MSESAPRAIHVRQGKVEPSGSWLYVWLDDADGEIVYVGATGFDPELRAFLHATSKSPDLGRARAAVAGFDDRDFTVLAFPLPQEVSRTDAKAALLARLDALGWCEAPEPCAPPLPDVVEPVVAVLATERAARGAVVRDA